MTAGNGIIHQEMPKESPIGTMWGLQFWANLPAVQKMMHPRYRDVKAADIPEITLEGGVLAKIIAGTVDGVQGPVKDILIEPEMLVYILPADSEFQHTIQAGHTAFIYILSREGRFDESGDIYQHETLLLFERGGDSVKIETNGKLARFMLVSGKPLGEPVAWGGPIVMNTQEELRTAFDEFNKGTFIKHD